MTIRWMFYAGALLLALFEIANVYFIMPLPGSQRMRSLEFAYALHQWRWVVRGVAVALLLVGIASAWHVGGRSRWIVPTTLAVVVAATWLTNVRMAADRMFLPPTIVRMEPAARNAVALDRLVVGVEVDGAARAYPLQFIGYHHQVRDTLAGRDVLVSYCTVCRTGRVFLPVIDGAPETFRLVGMDHFNAMLEDRTTGSWWRQANGEAVIGPRRGMAMPELPSRQVTLRQWLALYPHSLIMQADSAFLEEYSKDHAYERGTSRKALTGTDTTSWGEKSWVVGMTVDGVSRAYDWNHLERVRVINDVIGTTPIVLVMASDSASFFAFERPDAALIFGVEGDSLVAGGARYAFSGKGPAGELVGLTASQEFWHSWRTFHPGTDQYPRQAVARQ